MPDPQLSRPDRRQLPPVKPEHLAETIDSWALKRRRSKLLGGADYDYDIEMVAGVFRRLTARTRSEGPFAVSDIYGELWLELTGYGYSPREATEEARRCLATTISKKESGLRLVRLHRLAMAS